MSEIAEKHPLADQILAGGGEMGALMRAKDWVDTPLGHIETWPQSLRTSLSLLLASSYPMYIGWGSDYTVFYNDAYRPILGVTKHPDALGRPTREVWHEIWDLVGPWFDEVMTGESVWREDQLYVMERHGFPEECYFTFSYSPIRAEDGGVGGVFVTVIETTERVIGARRMRTLRDLSTSTSATHGVQEACAAASQVLAANPLDMPFGLLYIVNEACTHAELVATAGLEAGLPASPLQVDLSDVSLSPWPLGEVFKTRESALATGLQLRFGELPHPSWAYPPESALTLPILAPTHSQPIGLLVVGLSAGLQLDASYRDFLHMVAGYLAAAITKAQTLEQQRRRAQMLEELNRAKTVFFSNVSHEFRTPLTLLLNPLEDAMRGRQGEPVTLEWDSAQAMHRNTLRLLDFSRLEAGRMQGAFEPTDLALLTRETASSFRSAIESAGLDFVVDCPPLPEPVYADRDMWEKVVLNLLSNAFKFTYAGSIAITMRQHDGGAVLQVKDTGIGIPPDELPHIFQRFYRVRNTTARTFEGTGIGLSLVEELVNLHGGSITVESEEGVGTLFTITLPAGTSHLPADQIHGERAQTSTSVAPEAFVMDAQGWFASSPDTGAAQPGERAEAGRLADVPPGRLLIVDDNADMRRYLCRLLEPYWEVDTATNGLAALEAVEQRAPDVILADVMMPHLDGFGLLKRLREGRAAAHIPVIMLSARAGEDASVEGFSAGANDYLIKPFSSRELFARVRTQLEAAHAAAQRREHYEVSRQIALAERMEDILSALLNSAHFRDTVSAGFAWFNRPWLDVAAPPDHADVLAHWSPEHHNNDMTGLRFGFAEYGLALLSAPDQPVVFRDALDPALVPEAHEVFTALGSRSFITIPLIIRGVCRGYLFSHWAHVQDFTPGDIRTMQQLADLAAAALHNILLLESEARARKAAEQAGELKMRFMAMISHELRTPLASIKGFASTLLSPDVQFTPADEREFIEIINDESDKLMNLIEHLLDLTRMQAGTFGVRPSPVTVHEIIDSSMAQLRALSPDHALDIRLPGRLPRVSADKLRVGQVLTNLVSNACKFAPPGSPITITALRDQGFVRIDVADHGPGIPEEEHERIFQPFLQIDDALNNTAASGVGLGLTIARGIVDAHGGAIWVRPQTAPGMTISFTLPIAPDHWRARLKPQPPPPA